MIEIHIKSNNKIVVDKFSKENTNYNEVAAALLKLKQIEKKLVEIEFDYDIEMYSDTDGS